MRRRLLLIAAAVLAVLLLLVLTLPWWWGGVLRAAGGRFGLEFAEYQRDGYGRWAVEDVVFQREGISLRVERIEADHPIRWGLDPSAGEGLEVHDWVLEISPTEAPAESPAETPSGWQPTFALIEQVEAALQRWLPKAQLRNGIVRWPGGEATIATATWSDARLEVNEARFGEWAAQAVADLSGEPIAVQVRTLDEQWQVEAQLTAPRIEGVATWQDRPVRWWAQFPQEGWMPQAAQVDAEDWRVPGDILRMGEQYAEVAGSLNAQWQDGQGQVRLQASGDPVSGSSVPPLQVDIRAAGNPQSVTVEALQIDAPGIAASLDQPVTFDPRGELSHPADFLLNANLAELPYGDWAGAVQGQVHVQPNGRTWPRVQATFTLTEGAYGDVTGVEGAVEVNFEWPWVDVTSSRWRDAEGTDLEARGRVQLAEQRVENARVSGEVVYASLQRWVPETITFERVRLAAEGEGPFQEVSHQGQAEAEAIVVPGVKPLKTSLSWSGQLANVSVEATVQTADGAMELAGTVSPEQAQITQWQVRRANRDVFQLVQPVGVRWSPELQVDELRLSGPALELAAQASDVQRAQLALSAPRIRLDWLGDWLTEVGPVRTVRDLQVTSETVDGVLNFSIQGVADAVLADEYDLTVTANVTGDRAGVIIHQLRAASGQEPLVVLEGRLPLRIRPTAPDPLELEEDGELRLTGRVAPSSGFWTAVAQETGVQVVDPRVSIDLAGSWSEPVGSAELAAQRIHFEEERWNARMPEITDLQANLRGDGSGLFLEQFQVEVEGQRVTGTAQLPLTPDQWAEARQAPFEYLRNHGRGALEVMQADMGALARLAPAFLAPSGTVSARLEFPGDGDVRGALELSNAASRPLGPLGVLQNINAAIVFRGGVAEVRTVEATMGGQPIRLNGRAVLQDEGLPRIELRLRGQNLPLVRETGVILRADLDLGLVTDEKQQGRVNGNVTLRDGLFLADLQDVIPKGGGGARPASRPPYFSVTMEPLNNWRLDVQVEGRDFMRLRTPLLTGTASARFHLTGTLGEPRALGEATIDGGRIKLPFATFAIDEGEVRLTQADPYQPQLNLTATSRRMGYDLRMEVTGTASDPRVQFSSSPPLASEEILLLVMAGQAPQDEITRSGRQRAMAIGTFIGRGLLGDLLGGDGGGDRLTYTSGEKISRQGRETQRVVFEVSPRLSLVGEYDEFDSYNAGIRWRVLPRREPGETEDDG